MSDVTLYDLWPSTSNMKVRIALNYKGISFRKIPVEMGDYERKELTELSGQPLTPVLQHGDSVVFDSAAIIRYLEANFPETPKLFSKDRARMQEIEALEKWARYDLVQPFYAVFSELMKGSQGGTPDLAACERASAQIHEMTADIESRLQDKPFLLGDAMTAADATAAPQVFYSMVPDALVAKMPMLSFFKENLQLGEGRERTRDWCMRVMQYAL